MRVYAVLVTDRFVSVDTVHATRKSANKRVKILQARPTPPMEVNVYSHYVEDMTKSVIGGGLKPGKFDIEADTEGKTVLETEYALPKKKVIKKKTINKRRTLI